MRFIILLLTIISCGSPPQDLIWQYSTDRPRFLPGNSQLHGPVLARTQAIVCGGYGWDREGRLTSVDVANGAQRWSHTVGWCQRPPLVTETEAIGWGQLETNSTLMKSVDLESGDVLWQLQFPSQYQYAKPILHYETVLLSSRDTVLAIDARSGEVVRYAIPGCNKRESRAWLAYDTRRVLMGCNANVFTLDGRLLTTLKTPVRWALDTALRGDTLYLTESDALRAFDLANGQMLWQRTFQKMLSPPVVEGNALYVHVSKPWRLHRLNAHDGTDVWISDVRSFNAPLLTPHALYTTDAYDVVRLDPATGAEVERWRSSAEISGRPVLAGSAILFGNLRGELFAVRLAR
jgi:outer membrane protein assembly factor BamB